MATSHLTNNDNDKIDDDDDSDDDQKTIWSDRKVIHSTDLFDAKQKLLEAFHLDHAAGLIRLSAGRNVNTDDLPRVVNAGSC